MGEKNKMVYTYNTYRGIAMERTAPRTIFTDAPCANDQLNETNAVANNIGFEKSASIGKRRKRAAENNIKSSEKEEEEK